MAHPYLTFVLVALAIVALGYGLQAIGIGRIRTVKIELPAKDDTQ